MEKKICSEGVERVSDYDLDRLIEELDQEQFIGDLELQALREYRELRKRVDDTMKWIEDYFTFGIVKSDVMK